MRYRSTRGNETVSLSDAIARGLAPDGGLYVPEEMPALGLDAFDGHSDLVDIATVLLAPFFDGDLLAGELEPICRTAFEFPIPLKHLGDRLSVLELFHGPTAAFKDVGARFLAQCFCRGLARGDKTLTILVATSGDTGGAVAAAFHGMPGIEVVVLFPEGMVSLRQEKQLTSWGGNVHAFAVAGDFDACQRLAKEAMANSDLMRDRQLSSANSINIGRLLPQMAYYAWASLTYVSETGRAPGFIVPTGNLGNAAAALWAGRVGLPMREVVLATNANTCIGEFMGGSPWAAQPTVATLATAMDVGHPSNGERLLHLYGGEAGMRRELRAYSVSDDDISETIRQGPERWGEVWDPHTATAVAVRDRLEGDDWIAVATAHPAKFETVVEPLIGRVIPMPPALQDVLSRESHVTRIEPRLEVLFAQLG
jgi:threonine synthase